MSQPKSHTVVVEFGRLLPARLADRLVGGGLNLDHHFAFIDEVRIQDSNAGKIQQSLDQL